MSSIGFEYDDFDMVEEEAGVSIEVPTFWNIVPKEGLFLGLDISKDSSGITYIENGERITGNITLEEQSGVHKEVLFRRALKRDLKELVEGKEFDLIIIEDAFIGENPDTVRLLFALNTAIDEMILDGVCKCKNFVRVNNKLWKSWLYMLDSSGVSKGLNDKEKIRICLKMIGITEEGEGYQDRLDSTGLIVGYFLKGRDTRVGEGLPKVKKVRFSDIEASYDVDTSYLFYGRDDINRENIEFLNYRKISKSRVIELLTENPEKVFVTSEMILLGNLGIDLGLDTIDGGGYFAFWIKPSKLKKYIGGK